MSIVSFDGRYIFSDSICVTDREYQLQARKVFVHQKQSDGGFLSVFFTGALGLGCALAQEIFENYEYKAYEKKSAFGTRLNIPNDVSIDLVVIDSFHGVMFMYDKAMQSYARIPLQPITFGFDTAVTLVEQARLQKKSWNEIAESLEVMSNARTTNARYVAPPYFLTDTETGSEMIVFGAEA